MTPILVPTTDVNSDRGLLIAWHADNRSPVAKGAAIALIETSKAVIEVEAPGDGILLHGAPVDATVPLDDAVGYLFPDLSALERFEADLQARRAAAAASASSVRATQQARKRAEELGVDLTTLDTSRLITVKEVEAAAALAVVDYAGMPPPKAADAGQERVLLIGAALGATQVADILAGSTTQQAVAILDDDRSKWGGEVMGIPVIGGTDRLAALFAERAFDAAIITIGTSIPARVKFRTLCQAQGVPLTNAIDPSARLLDGVTIGTGNVICAFCHFGNGTTIGDNNMFSAHSSFDHHNVLGSEITTGPGCITSGLVTIGSRVKMGMGVHIEPKVEIGDDVEIASGSVILRSVPAEHAVKTKTVTTTVVPLRKF